MIPESNRATNIPSDKPDITIDRQLAFLLDGARSPTNGSISCGVTVVMPQMNEMPEKVLNCVVRHKPSHCVSTLVSSCIHSVGENPRRAGAPSSP